MPFLLFPIGGLVANVVVGLLLVAAACVAGVAAFAYIRAKNREAIEPKLAASGEGPAALNEMRELTSRIETIVTDQQDNGETQRAHLSRKIDSMRESVESQHHAVTGLRTELRHEIQRRDEEITQIRHQIEGIREGRALGPASETLALPPAPADADADAAPSFLEASFEDVAFEDVAFEDLAFEDDGAPPLTFEEAEDGALEPAPEVSIFESFAFSDDDEDVPELTAAPLAFEESPVFEESPAYEESQHVQTEATAPEPQEEPVEAPLAFEEAAAAEAEAMEEAEPAEEEVAFEVVSFVEPEEAEGYAEPALGAAGVAAQAQHHAGAHSRDFGPGEPPVQTLSFAEMPPPDAPPPETPQAWISRPERDPEVIGGVEIEQVGNVPPASGAEPPGEDDFPEPVVASELAGEPSFDFGASMDTEFAAMSYEPHGDETAAPDDVAPLSFEEATFEDALFEEAPYEDVTMESPAPEGADALGADAPEAEPGSGDAIAFAFEDDAPPVVAASGPVSAGEGPRAPIARAPVPDDAVPPLAEVAPPGPAPAPEAGTESDAEPRLKTMSASDLVPSAPAPRSPAPPPAAEPPAPAPPAPEARESPAEVPTYEKPEGAEDLTMISSVDGPTQQALHMAGVLTLDDIARWGRSDARRIAAEVGVSEETIMHQWVFEAQAALFDRFSQR